MADPINRDDISFGDVIEITERDGSKTQWRLDLNGGEPKLTPANVPSTPGLYSADADHGDMLRFRQLMLTARGEWFWLDLTAPGRDDTWVPATEAEVSGFELHAQYVVTRDEMKRAGR